MKYKQLMAEWPEVATTATEDSTLEEEGQWRDGLMRFRVGAVKTKSCRPRVYRDDRGNN
jgi:hypothetical protein